MIGYVFTYTSFSLVVPGQCFDAHRRNSSSTVSLQQSDDKTQQFSCVVAGVSEVKAIVWRWVCLVSDNHSLYYRTYTRENRPFRGNL